MIGATPAATGVPAVPSATPAPVPALAGTAAPATMADATVEELLDFVALEARRKGLGHDTIAGHRLDRSRLPRGQRFLRRLVSSQLIHGQSGARHRGRKLAAGRADGSGQKRGQPGLPQPDSCSAAGALARRTNFARLLRQLLKTSGLKYAVVAQRCGRPRHWIAHLLARRCGGVTGISLDEAALLDRILHAGGMLFATYLAHAQSGAFEPFVPAIDQVLGWNSVCPAVMSRPESTRIDFGGTVGTGACFDWG